jgi:hypothetical protein
MENKSIHCHCGEVGCIYMIRVPVSLTVIPMPDDDVQVDRPRLRLCQWCEPVSSRCHYVSFLTTKPDGTASDFRTTTILFQIRNQKLGH